VILFYVDAYVIIRKTNRIITLTSGVGGICQTTPGVFKSHA